MHFGGADSPRTFQKLTNKKISNFEMQNSNFEKMSHFNGNQVDGLSHKHLTNPITKNADKDKGVLRRRRDNSSAYTLPGIVNTPPFGYPSGVRYSWSGLCP